jgi:hypothetical protein
MAQRKQSAEEQLIDVGGFLMRQIFDVKATAESLRLLLEDRGVFSHEQYETMYAEVAAQLRARTAKVVADAESSAALRQLLQAPKGTVQ